MKKLFAAFFLGIGVSILIVSFANPETKMTNYAAGLKKGCSTITLPIDDVFTTADNLSNNPDNFLSTIYFPKNQVLEFSKSIPDNSLIGVCIYLEKDGKRYGTMTSFNENDLGYTPVDGSNPGVQKSPKAGDGKLKPGLNACYIRSNITSQNFYRQNFKDIMKQSAIIDSINAGGDVNPCCPWKPGCPTGDSARIFVNSIAKSLSGH